MAFGVGISVMTRMMRLGSHGDDVSQLQSMLRQYEPDLRVDGVYGPRTERAVRFAQRRNGLYPPDGIAGPMTMGALRKSTSTSRTPTKTVPIPTSRSAPVHAANGAAAATSTPVVDPGKGDPGPLKKAVEPARKRAEDNAMPPGVATPVASMSMSRLGRRFIYNHEAQAGVSNHLHHPSSGSGVTIGPGYDMKDRTAASVQNDLEVIGVDRNAAKEAAQGAGKSGSDAGAFVKDHKKTLDLSREQEEALLLHILPHYEAMVKRAIKIPLHQQEFDALVSYAYNPGGGWTKTTRLVNQNKPHEAMEEIQRHVYSKNQLIRSLVVRRDAESKMFLYGEYK
jgi:GH24 family phage-related lysozyme (muramidase)